MSIYRGMDKEDVVHIHNGILLSHLKKQRNNAICSNMDATRDYYTKYSSRAGLGAGAVMSIILALVLLAVLLVVCGPLAYKKVVKKCR